MLVVGEDMEKLNQVKNFLKRMLASLILFFLLCILIDQGIISHHLLFDNFIDFSYIRSKSSILFGKSLKNEYVSSEKINYKNISKQDNGYLLEVDKNYVIKSIKNGVVIFIGKKSDLGTSIIINSDEGVNIVYDGLENINVKLYDYIHKDTIIGSTITNKLYLEFKNHDTYLSYEDFL